MNTLDQSLVLFLVMLVGYYSNKKGILDEKINRGISSFLINVSLPFLIISSFKFKFTKELGNNLILAIILSFICFLITCFIGKIISINKGDKGIVLNFMCMFSNVGFMGFPVIQGIYGKEGVIYASILNMILTLFCWTYGIILYSGKKDKDEFKKIFKNPPLISTVLGIIILITSVHIPEVLLNAIKMVGGTTTPLAMILIGSMMAGISLKESIKDKDIYFASLIRLIVIPIILILLVKIFNIHSVVASSIIIAEAIPPATVTAILAETYDKGRNFAATLIFITTIISIATMPAIIAIMDKLTNN